MDMHFYLQGNGDLHMCGGHANGPEYHSDFTVFLDDLPIFYQVPGMNLHFSNWFVCCCRGVGICFYYRELHLYKYA